MPAGGHCSSLLHAARSSQPSKAQRSAGRRPLQQRRSPEVFHAWHQGQQRGQRLLRPLHIGAAAAGAAAGAGAARGQGAMSNAQLYNAMQGRACASVARPSRRDFPRPLRHRHPAAPISTHPHRHPAAPTGSRRQPPAPNGTHQHRHPPAPTQQHPPGLNEDGPCLHEGVEAPLAPRRRPLAHPQAHHHVQRVVWPQQARLLQGDDRGVVGCDCAILKLVAATAARCGCGRGGS
jgi:hypothetical protein